MADAVQAESDVLVMGGLHGLLESAPDATVVVDAQGRMYMVNSRAEALFGYPSQELLGRPVEMLVPDRLRQRHAAHRVDYAAMPHVRSAGGGGEFCVRRKDGSEFPAEISLSVLNTEDGTFVSSVVRDVTERTRSAQEASHCKAVIESSHDAIIGKDLNGVITSWNAGAERLYGYGAAEALGSSISMLVPPGRHDELPEILQRVSAGHQVDDYETVRSRRDGTQVDVALTVSPIRDRQGNVTGASTIARDITNRRQHRDQLQFLADHDALTGACNRRRFEREVSDQVGRAHRYGEHASLLIIDVDGFKQINDTYGHRVGDQALKTIVAALTRRLRTTDVVARIGGDEFAVLLPYAGWEQGSTVAASLRGLIGECTVEVPGNCVVRFSASIGVARIDADSLDEETVLVEADRLMYLDKHRAPSDRDLPGPGGLPPCAGHPHPVRAD